MVVYKETAEEQLLRMIEGPEGVKASSAFPAHPPPRFGPPARLWDELKDRFRNLLLQSRSPGDPFLWNLRLARRILWVVLAALGVYAVVDLVLIQPTFKLMHSAASSAKEIHASAVTPVAVKNPLKPLASYIEAILPRDPFTGSVADVVQSVAKAKRKQIEDLVSGFVLVGIDRGPHPAALVENTAQKRTFVVGVGDEINGMKVKKIDSDGVLLTYEGEEISLR